MLFHRLGACPNLQGVLDNFSRNAWHVRGSPRKDVSVGIEEVDERAFLFGGKHGANAHHFALSLLGLCGPPWCPLSLGVRRFFDNLIPDGCKLFGGDNCCGVFTTLDLILVGVLEGGADGDYPMWTQHLQLQTGVVGDGHELIVAWTSQDGMVGPIEPNHLKDKGLRPIIGWIPKGDG